MLKKIGVLSFSEPYWQDRLLQLKVEGFDEGVIARVGGGGEGAKRKSARLEASRGLVLIL